jgi:hypothetical protein
MTGDAADDHADTTVTAEQLPDGRWIAILTTAGEHLRSERTFTRKRDAMCDGRYLFRQRRLNR